MRFFLHNLIQVRLVSDTGEFSCSPLRFFELEPEYPALGEDILLRYWTDEYSYESDGIQKYPCTVNCGPYVDKIVLYTDYPLVYVYATLSKTTLCINADPVDSITFECHLKATDDPEGPDLPITQSWILRISHEDHLKFDGFTVNLVNGFCTKIFTYKEGLPLGDWFVDESTFALIEFMGSLYRPVLVGPVKYTLYRELS